MKELKKTACAMNDLEIIDQHNVIRETVGYRFISKLELHDIPQVLNFLRVVYNYSRMRDIMAASSSQSVVGKIKTDEPTDLSTK